MAQVREKWVRATNRPISVAFFSDDRYLSDDVTLGEALPNSSARSLELRAFPKSKYWLEVLGFEDTSTLFEVAAILTPAAVRRDLQRALDIHTDDFRLTWDGAELDQELPFNEQGLTEGAQLMVDLRVIANIRFTDSDETKKIDCFGSDSIGDLRQKLSFADDMALVATSPYRRVLDDRLRVCHVVTELLELEMPVDLIAERQVMLAFEPITLEHLRQKLPVFLSCTPLDVYDLVSERFQLTTEFRLAVNGQALDNCEPLLNQLLDADDVIQIDILRPCLISDLWEHPLDVDSDEFVYLYSTESSYALYLRDELNNQRVFYDDVNLTIFGSVIDVLGPISGQEKPVLLIDRDVQRNCPMLTFDAVMRRLGWARDMLLDIVPTSGAVHPNEVMRNGRLLHAKGTLSELRLTENTLTIVDPEKVFVGFEKTFFQQMESPESDDEEKKRRKLRICRLAHGATFGDVRAQMRQLKGSLEVGMKTRDWEIPNEAMDRKLDLELLFLTSASRYQTKLTVTVNGEWFGCWFEPQQVSFTDVMVNVGKQANVLPRHLFSKALFCCGCGRQLSKKEEPQQAIPAACCGVRSLQLTDRRVKDAGIQTHGTRRRDCGTNTLDPESRDVCVGPEAVCRRAVVSATPEQRRTVTFHPPPSSLRAWALNAQNGARRKTVTVEGGSTGRAILAAVDQKFPEIRFGHSPVIFSQEMVYNRECEDRRTVRSFVEETGVSTYVDLQDGEVADESSPVRISRRFLGPSSLLSSFPDLQTIVWIETEVEFFTMSPQRGLLDAPANALTNPSFVAFLFGVRSGAQFFWELSVFNYVNAASGQVFDVSEIGGPRRFVYAMLRNGDPVPEANVPINAVLDVYQRAGLDLRMEGGCVRCASGIPQAADLELWDFRDKNDSFRRDFTAACRSSFG